MFRFNVFHRSPLTYITGLLAKILKENNILQVQINAEHLRKIYKRVFIQEKKERRWSQQKNFFLFRNLLASCKSYKSFLDIAWLVRSTRNLISRKLIYITYRLTNVVRAYVRCKEVSFLMQTYVKKLRTVLTWTLTSLITKLERVHHYTFLPFPLGYHIYVRKFVII